ncbi:TlpA family protein disulfide reductase [Saprospiraceae bacterium]|nr:TlpA family protein disulfide reductase [Saprospiraceae bacterium]
MSKQLLTILFALFALVAKSQDITVYTKFDQFEKEVLTIKDDKIYVINLWATWCGPCVKELPYFEEVRKKYLDKNVEFILVTIDWETNLERKVKPFVKKKGLESTVIMFDDPKANDWIDKIDPSWSGAIPITLIMDKTQKDFYEKEYHSADELEADLLKFIDKSKTSK